MNSKIDNNIVLLTLSDDEKGNSLYCDSDCSNHD